MTFSTKPSPSGNGNGAHNGKVNGASESQRPNALAKLPASDEELLRKCVVDLVALIRSPETLRTMIGSAAFKERLRAMGEKDVERRSGLLLNALPKTEALLEPIGTCAQRNASRDSAVSSARSTSRSTHTPSSASNSSRVEVR
jgi:hypothetical protein